MIPTSIHRALQCILTFSSICHCSAFLQPKKVQQRVSGGFSHLQSVPTALDTLTSGLASIVRVDKNGLTGVTVASTAKAQGNNILTLYDVENSNDCRLVREIVTELDLVVDIVPVAKGTKNQVPNGAEAPCLVAVSPDGGDDVVTSGVAAISKYLKDAFSEASIQSTTPEDSDVLQTVVEILTPASLTVAGLLRTGRGSSVVPAASATSVQNPEKNLILYSYEGNQFCRLVREVLTELDISYTLRSAGKGSPRREELAGLTGGSTQCPYLVDPNTHAAMAESADIIRYLYKTYAGWTPPSELLEWVSRSIIPAARPIFRLTAPLQAGSSGEDASKYQQELETAKAAIKQETSSAAVVVYTYDLSPFSFEVKALFESLEIEYKEISLGKEWIPGLIAPNGAIQRAALLEMTGQSSLPHVFIRGKPIGGLFSGEPGLVPLLEQNKLSALLDEEPAFQ